MKFLIVDDSPADRTLVMRRLKEEFPHSEFIEIGRAADLAKLTEEKAFDVVLTDYQLNWTDGLQIFNRIKQLYPDVPVIMFTGTGSEEVAVEGMRSGLSNYVLKKHLDRLPYAIHDALEKMHLRKQYDEAIVQLRVSEERYRELFEQGLTGVFVCTPQGEILTCNNAFAHIFGFSGIEEALRVNVRDLYAEPASFSSFVQLVREEKRLAYHDTQMQRRDGMIVHVIENVVGTFDEQGKLQEIKGYLFDHTEQKRLSEQLQQAQRLESIGLLVSGIAHDFNNMLGGILGYTSRGLTKITRSHPLHDDLTRIQDIGTRAAKMTQQLLAFSRRQVLAPSTVDLNEIVENLLEFLNKILGEHIETVFEPDAELKSVRVDYAQIEQVLMNLCINARDAMPDGGKLWIETKNVEADEVFRQRYPQASSPEYVLLLVRDTGTGMDEQVRSQIFEPFFTTKELGKGTGLGLSMVHGIVGQHNGFIDVESSLGEGSTFMIYLPVVHEAATKSAPLTLEKPAHAVEGGVETILVVEDDPDLRFLMEEALGDYGYKVMSASDGAEGLQQFQRHAASISLIISDLMTPRMMGKELYDKVQRIRSNTKFLFVSGYQANQISQNFVLDKGFEFLQKPFDLDELAAKVREILA